MSGGGLKKKKVIIMMVVGGDKSIPSPTRVVVPSGSEGHGGKIHPLKQPQTGDNGPCGSI